MRIKKVTIEYDEATYVAEGDNARSWLAWMQEAEALMRSAHRPIWNAWNQIGANMLPNPSIPTGVVDGPIDPSPAE